MKEEDHKVILNVSSQLVCPGLIGLFSQGIIIYYFPKDLFTGHKLMESLILAFLQLLEAYETLWQTSPCPYSSS